MGILDKLKDRLSGASESDSANSSEVMDYVELDTDKAAERAKIIVRPFVLEDFEQIKPILDVLREGNTISLINIKPLKDRDLIELKRAINKLKKTCDAVEGDIAGFGENWIALVPSFAKIHRGKQTAPVAQQNPEAEMQEEQ
ncbi:cell division protein SepF [Candidatus Woesearchaeota archaeon]|nr:cell division protein SepF [Candidatus Woesearchaeota archaeon]MBI2661806.1 cell division protein SepF [Candidatus Woesearchaeota archaeon]